jgi:hypothetical protein
LFLSVTAAGADDWVAVKLRGNVLQAIDGGWAPLARGDVVSDDRLIATMRNGHVQFRRDGEMIDLGPDTQIQIADRSGKRFTTVVQHAGTVQIEANVEDVQHFAVQTPHLVAVVKGTVFKVRAGRTGSKVAVARGRVEVHDRATEIQVTLSAGQNAAVLSRGGMQVAGRGDLPVPTSGEESPSDIEVGDGGPGGSDGADGGQGLGIEVGLGPVGASVNAGGGNGIGLNVNVGGIKLGVNVGGNGNSGNGNSGNGSSNGNSGSGNSGSGNSGSGNGNSGNGNSGHGGGLGGTVGRVLGGLL